MKHSLVDLLACPACMHDLSVEREDGELGETKSGVLFCGSCGRNYPVRDFVPRFVQAENYAGNFGFQWNRFRRTQLDSHSGVSISRDRFFAQTGWSPEALEGTRVLDVGCGAGRFTEVALSCGAEVVALDYSSAVDACQQNLGPHPRLHVVQGSIYRLPFKPGQFDHVFCFGVLQHTPEVKDAFMRLPGQLRPGGRLAVDVYRRSIGNYVRPRWWLRPVSCRLPQSLLMKLVEGMVAVLLPMSILIGRIPRLGRSLRLILPVANPEGTYRLSREQLTEWSILDTFDMLSPRYDHHQSDKTLVAWFKGTPLVDAEVFRAGVIVGRARQSSTHDELTPRERLAVAGCGTGTAGLPS